MGHIGHSSSNFSQQTPSEGHHISLPIGGERGWATPRANLKRIMILTATEARKIRWSVSKYFQLMRITNILKNNFTKLKKDWTTLSKERSTKLWTQELNAKYLLAGKFLEASLPCESRLPIFINYTTDPEDHASYSHNWWYYWDKSMQSGAVPSPSCWKYHLGLVQNLKAILF